MILQCVSSKSISAAAKVTDLGHDTLMITFSDLVNPKANIASVIFTKEEWRVLVDEAN